MVNWRRQSWQQCHCIKQNLIEEKCVRLTRHDRDQRCGVQLFGPRSSGLRNGLDPLRLAVPKKRLCFFEERLRDSLLQPCAKKDKKKFTEYIVAIP